MIFSHLILAQNFEAVQHEVGIDHFFKHTTFLGGGAAFFDYDNDGDDDLYLTSGDEMDHFYENMGDGSFEDRSFLAGFLTTKFYYTIGVVAGDIDNDGFQDLFVTTEYSDLSNPSKNLLFKNNGDGTFIEIWGFDSPSDNRLSMGANMLDVNQDGFLDIYVFNYIDETSFIFGENGNIIGFEHSCYPNNLYINKGNNTFEDQTLKYQLNDIGCSLASVPTDYDLDGDTDLYIANDFGEFILPNKLFKNRGEDLSFLEVGFQTKSDLRMYGMGIASGDIDNDLDIDYYVTNYGENALLVNDNGVFEEQAKDFFIEDGFFDGDSLLAIGWGTVLLDIDNDQDLDLYVGNGYVPGPDFIPSDIYIPDKLFKNEMGYFDDITEVSGINNPYTTRGVSYSDYDNDGDLDILAVVLNVPMNGTGWQTILFENKDTSGNNWIQFSLEGTQVNRDAYGSRIYVYSDTLTLLKELQAGGSHISMSTNTLHFGLGKVEQIDSVKVFWTGGNHIETFRDLEINQRHVIKESAITSGTKNIQPYDFLHFYPNPASENLFFEFSERIEILSLVIYSLDGKIVKQFGQDSKQKFEVSLAGMNPGMYIIQVNSRAHQRFYKFIKS